MVGWSGVEWSGVEWYGMEKPAYNNYVASLLTFRLHPLSPAGQLHLWPEQWEQWGSTRLGLAWHWISISINPETYAAVRGIWKVSHVAYSNSEYSHAARCTFAGVACPSWMPAELQINLFAMRLDAANLWFIWFWSTKRQVGQAYSTYTYAEKIFPAFFFSMLCDPLAKRKVKTWPYGGSWP